MPWMTAAVSVSFVFVHAAMSPTPTKTGSAPSAVWKVQVGPVVVWVPSLTVAYHSNSWPAPRPGQDFVVVEPEATPVFWPICAKLPLASGRPKKVTVNGSESGSDTSMLRVGLVPIPVAPSLGAFRLGASGAPLPAGGTNPDTQLEPVPVMVPFAAVAMLSPTAVPEPSFRPQRATSPVPEVSS